MGNQIKLRKVKTGDEKVLAYIQTESWKAAFSKILSKENLENYADITKAEEMYTMIIDKRFGKGFLLFVDERPHCFAFWDKTREEEMSEYAELICIHSLCDNWGKGYGSQMMDFILDEIKRNGFNKVMLWVFEENHRARKFYEKHGFVLTEKTKKFCNTNEFMYCKQF